MLCHALAISAGKFCPFGLRHHAVLLQGTVGFELCTLLLYSFVHLFIPPPGFRFPLVVLGETGDFGDSIQQRALQLWPSGPTRFGVSASVPAAVPTQYDIDRMAHIPSHMTLIKRHNPRISNELKHKPRKMHLLFKKANVSGVPAQWQKFLDTTKKNKWTSSVLGWSTSMTRWSSTSKMEIANHFGITYNLRQDSFGVPAPKVNGKLFTSSNDKARLLLQEFCRVFAIEDVSAIPWLGRSRVQISLIKFQSHGVNKLILRLKPKKAAGPNRLLNRVLKDLAYELAPSLNPLNKQYRKLAFISPVYTTNGDVHMLGNYCPVSITTIASKLLEHFVC